MFTLYLISAIVSGILILLTLLGADHDHDAHFEVGHVEGGGHEEAPIGYWLPFLSLRFYTYLCAGFGITGLLLEWLSPDSPLLNGWVAGFVGLLAGSGVWLLVKILRRTESDSSSHEQDFLGKEAQVLVTIQGKTAGRVRVTSKGDIIDLLAISDEPEPIVPGSSVVIVAMEDGRALVMGRETIFADALPTQTG